MDSLTSIGMVGIMAGQSNTQHEIKELNNTLKQMAAAQGIEIKSIEEMKEIEKQREALMEKQRISRNLIVLKSQGIIASHDDYVAFERSKTPYNGGLFVFLWCICWFPISFVFDWLGCEWLHLIYFLYLLFHLFKESLKAKYYEDESFEEWKNRTGYITEYEARRMFMERIKNKELEEKKESFFKRLLNSEL